MTTLRAASATDVGKVRSNNQDQLLVAFPLFAVADGMGGHAAGEVASLTAVEALRAGFNQEEATAGLIAAAKSANRAVWDKSQQDAELRGMGTTLVALALVTEHGGEQLAVINVGDSRVYLLRDGELDQLTTDHSLVQELVDDGQLSEADALVHPQRHVLTRALGVDPDVPVDSIEVTPYRGDRFLLCSDGLSREMTDDQIASILRRFGQPEEAAKALVSEARDKGGNDNITVVVVDVVDDDDKAAAASAALASEPVLVIPSEVRKSQAEASAGGGGRRGRLRRRDRTAQTPKTRAVTFRVVGFVVLLLILLGGAAAGVVWYARGTYFVGVDQGRLAIYKGRPGGLLWFKPTIVEVSDVSTSQVPPSAQDDVKRGKEEATLADARTYVQNQKAAFEATTTTTTTTTGTPATTTPATTVPGAPASATPSSVP